MQRLTRSQLHAWLWASTTEDVAKEVNISGTAIAATCRRHDIPKPPLGSWARRRAGVLITIPPLPNPARDSLVPVRASEERVTQLEALKIEQREHQTMAGLQAQSEWTTASAATTKERKRSASTDPSLALPKQEKTTSDQDPQSEQNETSGQPCAERKQEESLHRASAVPKAERNATEVSPLRPAFQCNKFDALDFDALYALALRQQQLQAIGALLDRLREASRSCDPATQAVVTALIQRSRGVLSQHDPVREIAELCARVAHGSCSPFWWRSINEAR